jgi:hypothetical protein
MEGAEHKIANKTKWGWFVGIQWPMALALRPEDNKVISVSSKKIHCHEMCYAKLDPTTQPRPLICFTDFTRREDEVNQAIQEAVLKNDKELAVVKESQNFPKLVPSIKSLSDYQHNRYLNVLTLISKPPSAMLKHSPHQDHQGENPAMKLTIKQ